MNYRVHVYVVKGMVVVDVDDAKSQEDAKQKAIKEIEGAEVAFHGNYPPADRKYLTIVAEK